MTNDPAVAASSAWKVEKVGWNAIDAAIAKDETLAISRRFFDPKAVQAVALHEHLRDRKERDRREHRQIHRRPFAEIQRDHEQPGQRIDDHVTEHEQRRTQEQVRAAKVDLQFRKDAGALFGNQQSGLRPVVYETLHTNRPLIVT